MEPSWKNVSVGTYLPLQIREIKFNCSAHLNEYMYKLIGRKKSIYIFE